LRVGADVHTKFVATAHSPPLSSLIDLVRRANDFDDDGFGSLLGEGDCAPFDSAIRPGIRDIPDNGIDENCDGRDFSLSRLPAIKEGERVEVPEEFDKPWNILLLTIDTVRYDHTSFGGYIEKRKRDTTPHLATLVERSISFEDAHAPSAGTMASVPAILTSRFFHSGIALGPDRRGMPPVMKDSNQLISEILKSAGYYTGAILSHYYFNDWGMQQGFDTYDNELGKHNEPFKVTSHSLTDRALEWIGRNHKRKWFLWVHYIDPHGRYVAHPGEVSYGSSEEDLYDGELHYADKHVGRLLDELAKIPGGERTIVVITSDHGDGFNEHGFINHGMALYRELLHVPLIFYVPGANPRTAKGPVSPLDVVPTLAQLGGADTAGMSFEGRSLLAQILYGKDDMERVVFAETNYPKPLRAAISAHYKLIYDLKSNVYQLYDRRVDPWEKRNVWKKDRPGSDKMKAALEDWLERVYYARDFEANQVTRGQLAGVLLDEAPKVEHQVSASFDDQRIRVLGYDAPDKAKAGKNLEVVVYFQVARPPSGRFKLTVNLWDGDQFVARGRVVTPAGGVFPTSRWRAGDRIRVPLTVRVPRQIGDQISLAVRLAGTRVDGQGAAIGKSGDGVILGTLAIEGGALPPTPGKPRKRRPGKKK
ncbi:MAG: sulfatase-like hydrolase/transferase, partial [Deltaproteobacteria bacterium]|nr:sulfatase-like hydrolase/transferase [Deltaproteobacteria bacterium]